MIEQEVRTPTPKARGGRERRGARLLIIGIGIFLALVALRLITGETDITSSGTMGAALGLAVPIGMAALGGMWSERSGVVNIGLEGMMVLGTFGAAAGAYFTGNPWIGVATGIVAGALGGLLHALATVTFGVDHIVSGVAIIILAPGVSRYLSALFFTDEKGGGATQSPPLPGFPTWSVPGIGGPLSGVEKHHWVVVSDLAGLVRGLLTNLSPVTLIAVALVPVSFYLLWRTSFGLRLRSCGENPLAAESLGVKVYTMKYLAVVISGGLAGLGGVFLAMVSSSNYQEGQVNGRGFIGLAAMIFGNWRPGGVAAGVGLFGYTDALQLRGGGGAVHAMLLLSGAGLFALAIWHGFRRRMVTAAISVVVAAGLLAWFFLTDELPREIVTYSPHITTLVVLAFAAQRLRMPAADGLRYRKGGGH